MRTAILTVLSIAVVGAMVGAVTGVVVAQAPARFQPKPVGNLKQVMRSIPYPASNIIFDVQGKAPKDDDDWKTVQNAAMAIAETANLITLPGRLREDGKPVPVQNADWNKFAKGLVASGQACYKAALTKNQDAVSNCTDELSASCSNCHDIYRDKPQPAAPAAGKQGKQAKKQ